MNLNTVTIPMSDWRINTKYPVKIGYSGENDVTMLNIMTTIEPGFEYYLEMEYNNGAINGMNIEKSIIPLTVDVSSVFALLTSEMLGGRGRKKMQIRAAEIDGSKVKKSNIFYAEVAQSINALE